MGELRLRDYKCVIRDTEEYRRRIASKRLDAPTNDIIVRKHSLSFFDGNGMLCVAEYDYEREYWLLTAARFASKGKRFVAVELGRFTERTKIAKWVKSHMGEIRETNNQ